MLNFSKLFRPNNWNKTLPLIPFAVLLSSLFFKSHFYNLNIFLKLVYSRFMPLLAELGYTQIIPFSGSCQQINAYSVNNSCMQVTEEGAFLFFILSTFIIYILTSIISNWQYVNTIRSEVTPADQNEVLHTVKFSMVAKNILFIFIAYIVYWVAGMKYMFFDRPTHKLLPEEFLLGFSSLAIIFILFGFHFKSPKIVKYIRYIYLFVWAVYFFQVIFTSSH